MNKQQVFRPKTTSFTREDIIEAVNSTRESDDEIADEKFTDEICQQFADSMGSVLENALFHSSGDKYVGMLDQIAAKAKDAG